MNKLPKRKNIRLKNYDYSQTGFYHLTICTKGRKELLSKIVGGGMYGAQKIEESLIGKEIIRTINFIEN